MLSRFTTNKAHGLQDCYVVALTIFFDDYRALTILHLLMWQSVDSMTPMVKLIQAYYASSQVPVVDKVYWGKKTVPQDDGTEKTMKLLVCKMKSVTSDSNCNLMQVLDSPIY